MHHRSISTIPGDRDTLESITYFIEILFVSHAIPIPRTYLCMRFFLNFFLPLLLLLSLNCLCLSDSLVAPFLVGSLSRVIYLKPDLSVMRIYITCHFFYILSLCVYYWCHRHRQHFYRSKVFSFFFDSARRFSILPIVRYHSRIILICFELFILFISPTFFSFRFIWFDLMQCIL